MIQQTDREAWKATRTGRFTASTMGKLMTEARSKDDKAAGKLSEGALSLIKQKAVERVTKRPSHTAATWSMRRGVLLEHAACYLLSRYWEVVYACTWMPIGTNSGATPDFLRKTGSPGDIKCKESEDVMFDLATEVTDWNSLLRWNKDEAWQIATQALAAGSTKATLLYFTDKLQTIRITDEEYMTCNAIMEAMGNKLLELTGQIYDYTFNDGDGNPGFAFVAKTIDIPQEALERINAVLERAEAECLKYVDLYTPIYTNAPTIEQVEAQTPSVL
jgi:hypothetical protein